MLRLSAILLFALASVCHAGSWTNKAGHAISGELVGLKGTKVTIRLGNGRTRDLPLAAFRDDEQARIKLECGTPDVPAGLRMNYHFAKRQIKRAHLLEQQGMITSEERMDICIQAEVAFRLAAQKMVKKRQADASVIESLCAGL